MPVLWKRERGKGQSGNANRVYRSCLSYCWCWLRLLVVSMRWAWAEKAGLRESKLLAARSERATASSIIIMPSCPSLPLLPKPYKHTHVPCTDNIYLITIITTHRRATSGRAADDTARQELEAAPTPATPQHHHHQAAASGIKPPPLPPNTPHHHYD